MLSRFQQQQSGSTSSSRRVGKHSQQSIEKYLQSQSAAEDRRFLNKTKGTAREWVEDVENSAKE